jgi:UDP-N-acetylmuramoyl-L-alanyl-D-glutamate--2,6-diaminopimelate ligase
MSLALATLLADVGLSTDALRGDPGAVVASVAHDHRRVEPGALFCCVPGRTVDGHDLAGAAVAAGAVALVVERFLDGPDPTGPGPAGPDPARPDRPGGRPTGVDPAGVDVAAVPQVLVPSVRAVMGPLAAGVLGRPSEAVQVLGVTGTNGKTTVTYLLEAMVREAGGRPGVIGTVEVRIDGQPEAGVHTTPEAPELQLLLARMRDAGCDTVAMEVSSHALDQGRVNGTRFAVGCFTNLSHEHLDYHGSLAAYFEAKAALFDPARTAVAAVNVADPHGVRINERCRAKGIATRTWAAPATPTVPADVRAEEIRIGPGWSTFRLVAPELGPAGEAVRLGLLGRYNIGNAVGAAATGLAAGLPVDAVVMGLEAATVVPGRLERVDAGQDFTVVVDYAHTPDALRHVLVAARELTRRADARVLVVFGAGGDRDRSKRPLMGRVAEELADLVVVTTDNARSEDPAAIAAEVRAGLTDPAAAVVELDRRAAIALAIAAARPGDIVVVAGKGHEQGQTAGGATVPFDDRAVARACLEDRTCV